MAPSAFQVQPKCKLTPTSTSNRFIQIPNTMRLLSILFLGYRNRTTEVQYEFINKQMQKT